MTRYVSSRVVDGEQVAQDPQVLVTLAGSALADVFGAAAENDGVSLTPGQVTYRLTVETRP